MVPLVFQHMFLILFFPKREIVGDIYCHNLRQNYAACFSCLIEAIRGVTWVVSRLVYELVDQVM